MMVYMGNTGHIEKSKKYLNFILVPGIQKKRFVFDFPDFVYEKKKRKTFFLLSFQSSVTMKSPLDYGFFVTFEKFPHTKAVIS